MQAKVALEELEGMNATMLARHQNETEIHLYWLNTGQLKTDRDRQTETKTETLRQRHGERES